MSPCTFGPLCILPSLALKLLPQALLVLLPYLPGQLCSAEGSQATPGIGFLMRAHSPATKGMGSAGLASCPGGPEPHNAPLFPDHCGKLPQDVQTRPEVPAILGAGSGERGNLESLSTMIFPGERPRRPAQGTQPRVSGQGRLGPHGSNSHIDPNFLFELGIAGMAGRLQALGTAPVAFYFGGRAQSKALVPRGHSPGCRTAFSLIFRISKLLPSPPYPSHVTQGNPVNPIWALGPVVTSAGQV